VEVKTISHGPNSEYMSRKSEKIMKSTAEADQVGNTEERWAVEEKASHIEADNINKARKADGNARSKAESITVLSKTGGRETRQ